MHELKIMVDSITEHYGIEYMKTTHPPKTLTREEFLLGKAIICCLDDEYFYAHGPELTSGLSAYSRYAGGSKNTWKLVNHLIKGISNTAAPSNIRTFEFEVRQYFRDYPTEQDCMPARIIYLVCQFIYLRKSTVWSKMDHVIHLSKEVGYLTDNIPQVSAEHLSSDEYDFISTLIEYVIRRNVPRSDITPSKWSNIKEYCLLKRLNDLIFANVSARLNQICVPLVN